MLSALTCVCSVPRFLPRSWSWRWGTGYQSAHECRAHFRSGETKVKTMKAFLSMERLRISFSLIFRKLLSNQFENNVTTCNVYVTVRVHLVPSIPSATTCHLTPTNETRSLELYLAHQTFDNTSDSLFKHLLQFRFFYFVNASISCNLKSDCFQ